jgi:regulator of protease activity HflC (stomatin/prohibitin superfamily)
MKVADQSGAPILVSAILNYYVEDAKQAIFNVENFNSYVLNNAEAVLKQVVGRYSYYQLKSETEQINQAMLDTIRPLVKVAGARVTSLLLNELNYAPEVASGMLKTQQAGALLEARTIIVEGAVKIALDAVKMLEESGLKMTEEGKSKMVSNLLTVSVSDVDATPTISMT